MTEQIKINGFSFRKLLAASPKIVLLLLALLNFFAVPARYGHLCFYNWSGEFYNAFWVLVAAACLWINKRFAYGVAILACCLALYDFCYTALLYLGFLPLPPNVDASEIRFADWLRVMQHHPEEFTSAILATLVLIIAACYLLAGVKKKQRVFK
jgi:hypothetical protein